MIKHLTSIRTLMFASIAALGFSVTGCDFGNKTSDAETAGSKQGTMHEGDNADDTATADTAEVDTFR